MRQGDIFGDHLNRNGDRTRYRPAVRKERVVRVHDVAVAAALAGCMWLRFVSRMLDRSVIVDGDSAILEISDDLFRKTLETNTLGALRVTRAFVPLLSKSKSPRVINVSSGGGQLTGGADGWAPAYCISKTALNGVTSQLATALPKFAVNSVCPGWVRTDMGGKNASRSVEEGADTIVWLASEAPQDLTDKFLRDRKEIPW